MNAEAGSKELNVLDICSGSGCISLLVQSRISEILNVKTTGWDISKNAVKLARFNRRTLLPYDANAQFHVKDLFQPLTAEDHRQYDVVVANPPYISAASFNRSTAPKQKRHIVQPPESEQLTARSVRNWEPKLALVPLISPNSIEFPEDIFYHRILELQRDVFKSKYLILEVGDSSQAHRIALLAANQFGAKKTVTFLADGIENMKLASSRKTWYTTSTNESGRVKFVYYGEGNIRAVVVHHTETNLFREQRK